MRASRPQSPSALFTKSCFVCMMSWFLLGFMWRELCGEKNAVFLYSLIFWAILDISDFLERKINLFFFFLQKNKNECNKGLAESLYYLLFWSQTDSQDWKHCFIIFLHLATELAHTFSVADGDLLTPWVLTAVNTVPEVFNISLLLTVNMVKLR